MSEKVRTRLLAGVIAVVARYGVHYCCDIVGTWPKIDMKFYVEYVPDGQVVQDEQGNDCLITYELNAQASLTWDHRRKVFKSSPGNTLSSRDLRALMADSVKVTVHGMR